MLEMGGRGFIFSNAPVYLVISFRELSSLQAWTGVDIILRRLVLQASNQIYHLSFTAHQNLNNSVQMKQRASQVWASKLVLTMISIPKRLEIHHRTNFCPQSLE
jgi:hypothetical protein